MLRSIILICGWDVFRLAMACKFFGGLTNVHLLAMARNSGGLDLYLQLKDPNLLLTFENVPSMPC